jgi:hypothetical protein
LLFVDQRKDGFCFWELRTVTLKRNPSKVLSPSKDGAQQTGRGIVFAKAKVGGATHIHSVSPAGTAFQSGRIHAGDLLCQVNGVSVQDLTAEKITALMLGKPSSPITLTIYTTKISTQASVVQGEQKVQGLQGNAGGDSPEAPAGGQAQAQGKGGGGGVVGGVDETSLFERADALRGPLQPWDAARKGGLQPPPYEEGKNGTLSQKGGDVGGSLASDNKGGCATQ